jgi:hypothetical protein
MRWFHIFATQIVFVFFGTAWSYAQVVNKPPVFVQPAKATPNPVTCKHITLSAVADDDMGEVNLTYTWGVVSQPIGTFVTYSINGTNAAKNTSALLRKAGTYSFYVTATDSGGLSVTTTVSVSCISL